MWSLLKRLIVEREQQRESASLHDQAEAAEQLERIAAARGRVKAAVAAILRRYYGPRSETFDPRQLLLFGQQVDEPPLDQASIEDEAGEELVTRRIKKRHKHGRQQLPEHLERIEIEHDLRRQGVPGVRERALPDRGRGQRATRILPGQLQGPQAHPPQVRLREVRPRRLQPEHRHGGEAAAADRQGAAGAEPAGLRDHQQAGRPPAAVPAGKDLRAAAGAHRPQHDVCLDAVCRRIGHAAGRVDDRAGSAVASDPHRRHDGADPVARRQAVPQGPHLVLPGRRGQPVHRLRLHAEPIARLARPSGLTGYEGYLQADAYGGYDGIFHAAERDGSRLLGTCAAEVLRCAGLRRRARCARCWR